MVETREVVREVLRRIGSKVKYDVYHDPRRYVVGHPSQERKCSGAECGIKLRCGDIGWTDGTVTWCSLSCAPLDVVLDSRRRK